jgi:hypothetical protein
MPGRDGRAGATLPSREPVDVVVRVSAGTPPVARAFVSACSCRYLRMPASAR